LVQFEDLKVEIYSAPAGTRWTTAHIKATGADGQRNDEVIVLGIHLAKVDKKWQITELKK